MGEGDNRRPSGAGCVLGIASHFKAAFLSSHEPSGTRSDQPGFGGYQRRWSLTLLSSLPGLTRQSIHLRKKILAKKMDARVKPGHECVRQSGWSAWWESVPCEVTAYVAEGNCVAEGRSKGVAPRRGGEQPEANGQPVTARRMTNPIRRHVAASLLMCGEAWTRKGPIGRTR